MAYRRKIIDRRTREGKQLGKILDGAKALAVLAIIVIGWLGSRDHGSTPPSQELEHKIASPADVDQPTLLASEDASATSVKASINLHRTSAATGHQFSIQWPHVTANGVRWRLRPVGSTLLLLVDLGHGEIANVTVDPAFEALDLDGMNARVDHVRKLIGQQSTPGTSAYSLERDGNLRVFP